ncbi:glucosidase [soil metagenome]
MSLHSDAESARLAEDAARKKNLKRWGPYLSERQWATVREDYSADGDCWNYFPHDHARSRAYRWGEDGLLGITDRECRLCFGLAMWNGKDPILKERLFGLTNHEGNHGEDVKEAYFYIDSTPTHSYMKALYKYPQAEFPYEKLVTENQRRSRDEREYEIEDTGVFDENRYFDITAEYAKAAPDSVLIRLTMANRGPDDAAITMLPSWWNRNSWLWGCTHEGCEPKPRIKRVSDTMLQVDHVTLGRFFCQADVANSRDAAELIFTDNVTNNEKIFGTPNNAKYVKDAFHEFVVHENVKAVNRDFGTKAAWVYRLTVPAGEQIELRLRLDKDGEAPTPPFGAAFDQVFQDRMAEADAFYAHRIPTTLEPIKRQTMRQAYAGLLWSKQFYHYLVHDWLKGDPNFPKPPPQRKTGRNSEWRFLFNRDVISMPDSWEYPWYASWDLAFHMIPFCTIDPEFAKEQLILLLREWYMHPNGQIPAYEFSFSDANPPVHAWACWRVYKMTAPRGKRDRNFLARVFQKLLINFTWWVNRKDVNGNNIFAGGFLGLDNIGVFDRSQPLPTGGTLDQADGTAWMAFYCLTMLSMALELASEDPSYEDVASKFFEHFVAITDAINKVGETGLWNEADGFYYDQIQLNGTATPMQVRSMVGLIPMLAVAILDDRQIEKLEGFQKRMNWFLDHRKDLASLVAYMDERPGHVSGQHLLAVPSRDRLTRMLKYMLDEKEFLSPHGIRSLSRIHKDRPFVFKADGKTYRVDYMPAESTTSLFGGNSNWRGPVWMPLNYLIVEALERYHHFYDDTLKVECPVGSGKMMNLGEVAKFLSARLSGLFLPNENGQRPFAGGDQRFNTDLFWQDLTLFHEYFDGDTGRGLGASHQTGWTSLVARLMNNSRDMQANAISGL